MNRRESGLTLAFSCLGHLYIHLFTAFYFVILLSLESEWQLSYPELVGLWTLGSLLVGVAALPAGMLSDRLGATAMMIVFFLGMGAASSAAGLSENADQLMLALAGIGLFASIYHPVGIPWLVRSAGATRGKALGFNGVFGSLGSALAGIVAGTLIHLASWRVAFILPGLVSMLTGGLLLYCRVRGLLGKGEAKRQEAPAEQVKDSRRVFFILVGTMFLAGLIFHTTQTALPKVFDERHEGLISEGAFGVGLLVALVYAVAGVMQVIGGHLADRFPLKPVYLGAILIQIPALWLAASVGGLPLLLVATLMVMAGASALPAENMLLAKYTPERRHGLVFGLKFVLSFGAAPLAVQLVAFVTRRTESFYWVFSTLALFAGASFLLALALPREARRRGIDSGADLEPSGTTDAATAPAEGG